MMYEEVNDILLLYIKIDLSRSHQSCSLVSKKQQNPPIMQPHNSKLHGPRLLYIPPSPCMVRVSEHRVKILQKQSSQPQ